MAAVTVVIPGLLARFADGRRRIPLDAGTVEGAIETLLETHPDLRPHLFTAAGTRRRHLHVFHEGDRVEPGGTPPIDLSDGDEIVVLQAVSGG